VDYLRGSAATPLCWADCWRCCCDWPSPSRRNKLCRCLSLGRPAGYCWPGAHCGRHAPVRGSPGGASSTNQSTAQVVPPGQSAEVTHRPPPTAFPPARPRCSPRRRAPRGRTGGTRTAGQGGPPDHTGSPPAPGGPPSAGRMPGARRTCQAGPAPSGRPRTASVRPRRWRGRSSGGRPHLSCGNSHGRTRGRPPLYAHAAQLSTAIGRPFLDRSAERPPADHIGSARAGSSIRYPNRRGPVARGRRRWPAPSR
jgi:hypothetical protein